MSDETPTTDELPAHITPHNIVHNMRVQARSFKDLPPWPGLKYLKIEKLPKEHLAVLEARKTRSRLETAKMLKLSFLQVRDAEKSALKIIERRIARGQR